MLGKTLYLLYFHRFFWSLIEKSGFINTIIVVLIIVALQIILSIVLRDNNISKESKTNLKEFNGVIKEHPKLKSIIRTNICSGLTYSDGALSIHN